MIKKLYRIFDFYSGLKNSNVNRKIQSEKLIQRLRAESKSDLNKFGWKIYSQNDEDGIIHEIFKRIKIKHNFFVEIGTGTHFENNTLNLLCEGWRGVWIDGNKNYIKNYENLLLSKIPKECLQLLNLKIYSKNINVLRTTLNIPEEIDFLSIDIDSHEIEILKNLDFSPRVICVEYNAKFRGNFKFEFSEKDTSILSTDFWGNSLSSINDCLSKKGYSLVGCNITGCNSFFVKKELALNNFYLSDKLEDFYLPARYYLSSYFSSSIADVKTIIKRILSNYQNNRFKK